MNLSENLKKIRKDNNLSQEALAEKLGVSRQSVSKWESGLAYPEMDKVLQLCEMFNLNIDELLNQNIKEVEKNKQTSFDVNKYINEFLNYITKTVNMFSSMKFKDKIKCLFEQAVIIILYIIAAFIIGEVFSHVVSGLINFLPNNIYYYVYRSLESVYFLGALCLGILIVLHIFKTRYLDYYVVLDKEEETQNEEVKESEEKFIKKDDKKELHRKEEKVIIRDEKHSSYRFFTVIGRIVLFFIKLFVGFVGLNFCASLVGLVVLLVLSFLFIKTGLLWFGGFIGLIGAIAINLIILDLIYSFIFNKKVKVLRLFVLFVTSLVLGGIGIACCIIGAKDFRYINSYDENYMVRSEQVIKWDKNLIMVDYYNIDYVESNDKDLKIVYEKTPSCDVEFKVDTDKYIYINHHCNDSRSIINYYIDTLNDKVVVNPDYMHITVYTSKENINILKTNKANYLKKLNEIEEKEYIKNLKNRISELENELDKKYDCECNE